MRRTLWSILGNGDRFKQYFDKVQVVGSQNLFHPGQGDVCLFHGGHDIWAGMYGETPVPENETPRLNPRDIIERKIAEACIERGVPMIGICRGAQLLCILAGGSLFQHVDGHRKDHALVTESGTIIPATPQSHHQMMRCTKTSFEPLAWTPERLSTVVKVGAEADATEDWEESWEIEIAYFPVIQGLAIQPHPEWMGGVAGYMPFHDYCDKLVREYILR